MNTKAIILIASVLAISVASAQQMTNNSANDYKHPQMAQKAEEQKAEKEAAEASADQVEFVKNDNYKDQTNNALKERRRKKKEAPSPVTSDRPRDYKHPFGL